MRARELARRRRPALRRFGAKASAESVAKKRDLRRRDRLVPFLVRQLDDGCANGPLVQPDRQVFGRWIKRARGGSESGFRIGQFGYAVRLRLREKAEMVPHDGLGVEGFRYPPCDFELVRSGRLRLQRQLLGRGRGAPAISLGHIAGEIRDHLAPTERRGLNAFAGVQSQYAPRYGAGGLQVGATRRMWILLQKSAWPSAILYTRGREQINGDLNVASS